MFCFFFVAALAHVGFISMPDLALLALFCMLSQI